MSDDHETYGQRLAKYERRVSMTTWVGTGFITLIACLAAGALKRGSLFAALVFTFILFGGGSLAFARVKFEWAGTQIKRKIDASVVQKTDKLIGNDRTWPQGADNLWFLSLFLTLFGGLAMWIGIWWEYFCIAETAYQEVVN